MPGISTEYLAEPIERSNRRQDVANNRMADEIHELGHKFDDFRAEVSGELGEIDASLKIAGWAITVAVGVAPSVVASVIAGTRYLAKLDSRVQQLESHALADHGGKGAK